MRLGLPGVAGSSISENVRARSRLIAHEPMDPLPETGQAADRSRSGATATAISGISPTMERIFSGTDSPLLLGNAVVIKAVLFVPETGAAERVDRIGDGDEMLEELRGDVLVNRIVPAPAPSRWRAWSGNRRPSTPCRRPARANCRRRAASSGRTRRYCRAQESRRRKDCGPAESLRFTHQVKFISSFWNALSRKREVAVRRASPVIL